MPSLQAYAVRLLARRDHSRAELREKLLAHGMAGRPERRARRTPQGAAAPACAPSDEPVVEPANTVAADVERVLAALTAAGLASDARCVDNRIASLATRCGNRRLMHDLAERHVQPSAVQLDSLRDTELQRAHDVWSRRLGTSAAAEADAASKARQWRFLAGRGFSSDTIRRLLRDSLPVDSADTSDGADSAAS